MTLYRKCLSSRISTSAWCWLWRFAFLHNSDLSDSDSVDYLDLHSLSLLIAKVEICLPSPKISQIKLYFVRAAIHSPSWNMTLAAVQVSIFNRIKAKGCNEGVFPYLWRQSNLTRDSSKAPRISRPIHKQNDK